MANPLKKLGQLLDTKQEENILLAYNLLISQELYSPEKAFLYIMEFFLDEGYDPTCHSTSSTFRIGNILVDYSPGGHDGYGGNSCHEVSFYIGDQTYDIDVETDHTDNWIRDKKEILKEIKALFPKILPIDSK